MAGTQSTEKGPVVVTHSATGEITSNTNTNATSSAPSNQNQNSRLRQALFPIYGSYEVTKFLLMGSFKFFIVLALVLTRDTKDTLVVTQCGAEAIAFLKIYGVLPAATAFIALYSKMASTLDRKPLFYATSLPFFLFFTLFGTILFPNAAKFQPSLQTVQSFLGTSTTSSTTGGGGGGGGGGTAIVSLILANWTSALFYIIAEVYSSVSIGILFWQFANDVVPVHQAQRFYPLFAQMSGLAPIVAGQYAVRYASRAKTFAVSFHRLTIAIAFAGVAVCGLYHIASEFIERHEGGESGGGGDSSTTASTTTSSTTTTTKDSSSTTETTPPPIKKKKKKSKPKMTMLESAKFLSSSQYLRLMSILVIGYGLSINFTEILWKSLVKQKYPQPLDYQRFMGNFSSILGFSTCVVILLGVQVIRLLGWRAGALATPSAMAVLAIPFFGCVLLGLDNPARLSAAVMIGAVQNLLSKTGKYAMFDPTTQMAYIPLDEESKVKGKAAIDVLGSRIGKSGGSLIQQGLIFAFGNILDAAPVLMVIFYGVVFGWIVAANRLSGLFAAKTAMAQVEKKE